MRDHLISQAAFLPYFTWLAAAALGRVARGRSGSVADAIRTVRNELHPFRWALAVLNFVVASAVLGSNPAIGFNLAFDLFWCWVYRNEADDDDRWKRRLDAATGYVREVAGRLVVVPAPAGGAA